MRHDPMTPADARQHFADIDATGRLLQNAKLSRHTPGRCYHVPGDHDADRTACGNDPRKMAFHELTREPTRVTCPDCQEDETWHEAMLCLTDPKPLRLGRA